MSAGRRAERLTLPDFARGVPEGVGPEERARDEMREELRARALRATGVPERYRSSPSPEAMAVAGAICRPGEGGPWLAVVAGPRGSGRTALACGVVAHFCETGTRGVYVGADQAISGVRETFGNRGSEDAAIERLAHAPALAIDDLGRSELGAWAAKTLLRVLDSRYQGLRPTVVVVSEGLSRLAGRLCPEDPGLSEAIAERLATASVEVTLSGLAQGADPEA